MRKNMKIIKRAKPRTLASADTLEADVKKIINDVRKNGDATLAGYNKKFDDCIRGSLRVSADEISSAYDEVSENEIEDIRSAAKNIRIFAEAQRRSFDELQDFSPSEGVSLGHRIIPVQSVCCYVPGGGYPLYSTALMLGIPAKVAGVERVIACSPAIKGEGRIHPKTIIAMNTAGVDEIYVMGGAQAIAAVTYGTGEIAPVDMIVGPGNSYVTEAKRQCYGKVGIDFLAGPSEVLIIADKSADPKIVAADMLAQAEHDPVAKAILVTTDEKLAENVIGAAKSELSVLETSDIAERSWDDYGEVLLASSLDEAAEYANTYAPEHLEICVIEEDEERMVSKVRNYGSLFIGQNTAEVFGDYASGTNHTLPTLGAARYTGGVWVGTFVKICTNQKMTVSGSKSLAPLVENLARGEGLMAHAQAAHLRKTR